MKYADDHFNLTFYQTVTTPINRSSTGYGSKIPTQYMAIDRDSKRKYRVYAICYSNCSTLYISVRKEMYTIRDFDIPEDVPMLPSAISKAQHELCQAKIKRLDKEVGR